MIGNDVVDLKKARTQSNWQRNGFLNKVFTKKEQQVIKNAKDSFTTVWLLWSMKESAYKIYSRQHNVRFFAPKKFECDINNSQHVVKFNNTVYFTKSSITINTIYTVATLNINEFVASDFFKLKNDTYAFQNNTSYERLKYEISNQLNIPIAKIKIEKDSNGIPHVNHEKINSISISHHGVFGAYAFIKCN